MSFWRFITALAVAAYVALIVAALGLAIIAIVDRSRGDALSEHNRRQ